MRYFNTLIYVILLCALQALGQEKTAEKTMGPFTGTVVDSAGKPVAGAKVWLLGGSYLDPQAVDETTADAEGRFQFAERKWDLSADRAMPPTLTARDSQGRIGGQIRSSRRPGPESPAKPFQDIQVKLQEVKDCQGRLVDDSGGPIVRATIRPVSWSYERRERNFVQELIWLPANLGKEMSAESGPDGKFTLRSLPVLGRINVKIHAEGFGEPRAMWKLDKSVTLKLRRTGGIQGTLACPQEPQAAADITLRLEEKRDLRPYFETDLLVSYYADGVTQKDGSFRFDDVPPAPYLIRPKLPAASPYYCESSGAIEVQTGKTATAVMTLKPAVKVQGKVVDGESGEGVSGVRIHLNFNDEKGDGGRENTTTTDAQGAFTLFTRPGKASLQIWQLPEIYGQSYARPMQTVELKENMTLDPIRLEKMKTLEGIVVDAAGKPVAGAEIHPVSMNMNRGGFFSNNIRSDAAGKFSMKGVNPQDTYVLRARTNQAAAEPVNVVPEKLQGPLRLVLNEKTSFTLRGTLVDDAGKPIAGAEVLPQVNVWYGNWGTSFGCEARKTDAAGKFEVGGLWPGDKHEIRITANGYESYGSLKIVGAAGGVHDFGRIVLVATNGVVEGKTVDSSGRPVADARVFNSGDGPEPMETRSDEAGKFRLQNFRQGPVFVFAEKEEYRFTGLRTHTGAADVVLKMLKSSEPVPPRPAPGAASREEEKQAARKLLEKIWAATADDGNQRRYLLVLMLKIDPALARQWAEQSGINLNNPPNRDWMKKVAEDDLDEALSLILKDPGRAYYYLEDLVKHFAASEPEKALRCAEEAVVRARSQDQPARAVGLAKMGVWVARLGHEEAGKKLALEAADMAAAWKGSRNTDYCLGSIAAAVAQFDASRALDLLGKIDKDQRRGYLPNVVAAIDDLEKAEALLKDLEPWYQQRARMRLAYRIAAKRPAEAIRLVENIPARYGSEEDSKALAFGWLANAAAPNDPALAYSLIDRAFTIYLKPSDRSFGSYGGRGAQAAFLAVQAQEIGYPDVESAVYRALAARPAMKDAWSPVALQESFVVMAMYLALVDPPTAKAILHELEPVSEAIGTGYSGVGREEWLKAWALADPQHARELAERELASAKDQEAKERAQYAVRSMVELWATDPGQRLKSLSRRYSNMLPFEEDDF